MLFIEYWMGKTQRMIYIPDIHEHMNLKEWFFFFSFIQLKYQIGSI